MAKKQISTLLDAELIDRVDAAAQELEIGRRTYIKHALEAKLENRDQDEALAEAHTQRDHFKARMEEAFENLAVADAKLKAYRKRSWLAKLVGWKPKSNTTEGIPLEALIHFHSRLKTVGMTPKQIEQILHPLYQSAGVPLIPDSENEIQESRERTVEQRPQGRD